MIVVEEGKPIKLPTLTSLKFSSAGFYDKTVWDLLRQADGCYFDKKTNTFEFPPNALCFLVDVLCTVDDVKVVPYYEDDVPTRSCGEMVFKVKPYKHQLDAVNYGLNHTGWMLLDDQGLGKTGSMIYLAETLKRYENLEHCFIICGVNGLKFNWASEIEKFSDLSWHILGQRVNRRGNIVIGSVEDRLNDLRNPIDEFFVITNIETLQNKNFAQAFNSSKNHFDMIILDEAHRCKSPSALSVKTLLKVKAKRCIALTGTVIVNNPENAYVPLKWTGNTNSNYSQFNNMYNVYGGFGGVQVLGHKNLDLLKQLLASCSLRRLKSDVLDLPEKTYITDYVEMYDDQRKLYLDVQQGIADELNKLDHKPSIMEEITINMRLRQITAYPGMLSTEVTNSAKIERTVQLVQDIVAQGDKVVIFSNFKETVYELERRLSNYGVVVCTGDHNEAQSVEARRKFQEDDNVKVFIGTWQKMGTGFTLHAASYAIFIDTPWTYASFEQACDRLHRIGQNKKVFIITLITKDTYDERVQEILQCKEDLSKFIVDNGDDKNLSLYE